MGEHLEKIKHILSQELGIDKVSDHLSQEVCGEWDSLAFMSIVSRIEDEFQVEATQDNIQKFQSIDGILAVIGDRSLHV